jgi:hypothetical protein
MGTTSQKLQAIVNSKEAIRQAIVDKGVMVVPGTKLSEYASLIRLIQTPSMIAMTALMSGNLSTGLINVSGVGTGTQSTISGSPAMDSTVNIVCISGLNILYQGNAGVPTGNSYIPFLEVNYIPTDGTAIRTGYLSIIKNPDSSNATYAVIDKNTSNRIILDSTKTYILNINHCIILRNNSTKIIEGSTTVSNGLFGLTNVTADTSTTLQISHSVVNPSPSRYENIQITDEIKALVQSGNYPSVTITSTFMTGTATSMTGYYKGLIVSTADYFSFS